MHKKQPASPNKKEADCFIGTCMYVKIRRYILRSCFEFLQKVFLGLMYPFSCVLWAIFWSFSLQSSHDKFKTASYALSVDCLPCPDYNVIP